MPEATQVEPIDKHYALPPGPHVQPGVLGLLRHLQHPAVHPRGGERVGEGIPSSEAVEVLGFDWIFVVVVVVVVVE